VIPSIQNKSRDQLAAEFDAVFGGLISTPAKKPTTYRRIGTGGGGVWIIIPGEVKITQVLANLRRPLGERYLLILSNLYVRGLYRKKTTKKLGNYLPMHRDILRTLGGENYFKLIEYGQSVRHLIKSPQNYIEGVQANKYMLNRKGFSLKTQQRYELTTKAAIRIRSSDADDRKAEFVSKGSVYQKIADSVDGLEFDYDKALKYVSSLPNGDQKIHRKNIIEQLMFDGAIWSHDGQGRNYTVMVNVPRDIRRYFTHSAGPLYLVDVSSCHALLHLHLYPSQGSEEKKYRNIVENGRFWTFMNDAAGKPFNLSVPDEKEQLKTTVMADIFYSHAEPKGGVKKLFAVTFKREFPILWEQVDDRKRGQRKDKPSAPISKAMMTTESEVVHEAMNLLQNKPYPLITIHDSIVTTKNGVADVRQALQQAFAQLNLNPTLREELLTA